MTYSHVAYSDESFTAKSRYRSIALITLACDSLRIATSEIAGLLDDSNVSEFKWSKLRTAKTRFAALKLIDWSVDWASQRKLRVDVLIWDMEDSRNRNVLGRDDNENFSRMYYHLLSNVLRRRWSDGTTWKLYPDQNSVVDWSNLQNILNRVGQWASPRREQPSLLSTEGLHPFGVVEIAEVDSCQAPLCQIADLLAGLSVFSYERFGVYQQWCKRDQPLLPGFQTDQASLGGRDTERCKVLEHFDSECKRLALGVSLDSSQGFRTRDPNNPINFWLYQPQHPEDKAPTRTRARGSS